jgi:hypothetical protein
MFGSMMFYMFRGFQRLQIYNFLDEWIKGCDLNGENKQLNHLIYISKSV